MCNVEILGLKKRKQRVTEYLKINKTRGFGFKRDLDDLLLIQKKMTKAKIRLEKLVVKHRKATRPRQTKEDIFIKRSELKYCQDCDCNVRRSDFAKHCKTNKHMHNCK